VQQEEGRVGRETGSLVDRSDPDIGPIWRGGDKSGEDFPRQLLTFRAELSSPPRVLKIPGAAFTFGKPCASARLRVSASPALVRSISLSEMAGQCTRGLAVSSIAVRQEEGLCVCRLSQVVMSRRIGGDREIEEVVSGDVGRVSMILGAILEMEIREEHVLNDDGIRHVRYERGRLQRWANGFQTWVNNRRKTRGSGTGLTGVSCVDSSTFPDALHRPRRGATSVQPGRIQTLPSVHLHPAAPAVISATVESLSPLLTAHQHWLSIDRWGPVCRRPWLLRRRWCEKVADDDRRNVDNTIDSVFDF
jgi:hypothetical protein